MVWCWRARRFATTGVLFQTVPKIVWRFCSCSSSSCGCGPVLDKVVDVPFVVLCVDKLVDVPVVQVVDWVSCWRVPTVQTVQKTSEIPQVMFLDMVVTLVVGQRQVRRRLSMSLLLQFTDKARTSL